MILSQLRCWTGLLALAHYRRFSAHDTPHTAANMLSKSPCRRQVPTQSLCTTVFALELGGALGIFRLGYIPTADGNMAGLMEPSCTSPNTVDSHFHWLRYRARRRRRPKWRPRRLHLHSRCVRRSIPRTKHAGTSHPRGSRPTLPARIARIFTRRFSHCRKFRLGRRHGRTFTHIIPRHRLLHFCRPFLN